MSTPESSPEQLSSPQGERLPPAMDNDELTMRSPYKGRRPTGAIRRVPEENSANEDDQIDFRKRLEQIRRGDANL